MTKDLFVKGLVATSKELKAKFDNDARLADTDAKASQLFKKIYEVRKVKTLWQMEKPVDITTFYHTPKIGISATEQKQVISVDDLGTQRHTVILGIAGQGKSMLIRQLSLSELAKGTTIPIFIELRKITAAKDLKQLIQDAFEILDIEAPSNVFDYLCKHSKLCLLLDGFDEIEQTQLSKTVSEIELLADKYSDLTIIISSRPDSGTDGLRSFSTVRMCDLAGDDYKGVMLRLLDKDNPELYDEIIEKIRINENQVDQLLTTPLMVTLLLIKYKFNKEVPATFSAFYDGVLDVLLTRHDALKPGYVRKRESGLNDHDFRTLFEALTFKLTGKPTSISDSTLTKACSEAITETNATTRPGQFINDLVKITCLLLKDGSFYRFIHKSVQEYYSAAYISKKPEPWVKSFFIRARASHYMQLKATTDFLNELDHYKWAAFYYKPLLEELLGGYKKDESVSAIIRRVLGDRSIQFSVDADGEPSWKQLDSNLYLSLMLSQHQFGNSLSSNINVALKHYVATKGGIPMGDKHIVSIGALVDLNCCESIFNSFIPIFDKFAAELIEIDDFIAKSTKTFEGF